MDSSEFGVFLASRTLSSESVFLRRSPVRVLPHSSSQSFHVREVADLPTPHEASAAGSGRKLGTAREYHPTARIC